MILTYETLGYPKQPKMIEISIYLGIITFKMRQKEIFFDNMFTLHAYANEDEFYSDWHQPAVHDQHVLACVNLQNVSDVNTI